MPRNACVIQITPVRLTRTSTNDASVVRKIYLSIDPIVTYDPRPVTPARRAATKPFVQGPLWSRRRLSRLLYSLYHPFDPSTKWLSRGALGLRLIFPCMWRPGNGRAWQQGGWRAI